MDLYTKLIKRPFIFKRLTGTTIEEFDSIIQKLQHVWFRRHERKKKIAGRPYGVGNLENQLVCLLLYYRTYTTQLFIGWLFSVDDATISRSIKRLEPILAQVVAIKKERKLSHKEVEELIVDCTEQPIQRPKKRQKQYYSGKKKRHTIKTEIQVNRKGRIIKVSKPHAGKKHDMQIRKESGILPQDCEVYGDSGYQGLRDTHKKAKIPIKKSKNRPLNNTSKAYNRALAHIRIGVEHKIRELKIFCILAQTYRNPKSRYGVKMKIIAGIVNIKNGF